VGDSYIRAYTHYARRMTCWYIKNLAEFDDRGENDTGGRCPLSHSQVPAKSFEIYETDIITTAHIRTYASANETQGHLVPNIRINGHVQRQRTYTRAYHTYRNMITYCWMDISCYPKILYLALWRTTAPNNTTHTRCHVQHTAATVTAPRNVNTAAAPSAVYTKAVQ
jgi:hypothetical protein